MVDTEYLPNRPLTEGEFEQQFADDRQGRIALYIHDDDLEKAGF